MEYNDTDIYKEVESRRLAESSLYEFIKQAWSQIEKGPSFVGGWHIQALCEHLEALYRGEIKNLLVNIPPRSTKTITCSSMFPSWVWIKNPSIQFLCLSHSQPLSTKAAVTHRDIITSEWYKLRWGHIYELKADQNQKTQFSNNKSGYRISRAMRSGVTGDGANIIIVDDPNNAAASDMVREETNERWDSVVSTRLNDTNNDKRLLVQQRTNENDLTGHILKSEEADEWTKLIIPMEFEAKRRCKTIILPSSNGKQWKDPRTTEKESICPIRFNAKAVASLKKRLGSPYLVAGQLQQRPAPEEGGLFKKRWFRWWNNEKPPKVFQVIESWDTAFKKEDKRKPNQKISYSVCTVWGLFNDEFGIVNVILLNIWRDRVEFPELREVAKKLAKDYRYNESREVDEKARYVPDMILIEAKATGDPLNQELRRAGIQATMFDPGPYGDKVRRASLITHIVEAGRVWVPARGPNFEKLTSFANLFVDACANFPNDDSSKDIVDTLSQMLHKMIKGGIVKHPNDPKDKVKDSKPRTMYGIDGVDT
jgi:predicted phage terminase large subunit-like protein